MILASLATVGSWAAWAGWSVLVALSCLTILVSLPGGWIALGLAVLYDLLNGFDAIGWGRLAVFAGLLTLGEGLESLLGLVYVAKKGATRYGLVGATLGGFVGAALGTAFTPIVGSIVGGFTLAFVGAVAGEYWHERRLAASVRIGLHATVGRLLATTAKYILAILGAVLVIAAAAPRARAQATAPDAPDAPPALVPLLVTVDDLPIAAERLHADPAARQQLTRDMLEVLDRHGIRAVGLVTWSHVHSQADRQLLRAWLQHGHELGNHSFGHLDYTRTPFETYVADVERGRAGLDTLLRAEGRPLRFFRFPFLREGDTPAKLDSMRAYLRRSGQRNLPVTIDDQDWSFEEPWVAAVRARDAAAQQAVAADYLAALRISVRHHTRRGHRLAERPAPQILLLHANAVGAAQWDALFTWLKQEGFRFASADEVLSDPLFAQEHRYIGPYGCSLWDRLTSQRAEANASDRVQEILRQQATAWSQGDLDAFCSVYADDCLFLSPNGVTRGRQAVLDRYRSRYPDRQAMGALTLEPLEIRPHAGTEFSLLGDAVPGRVHTVTVAARWTLARDGGEPTTGVTLLVLRARGDRWEIVQDASM